MVCSCMLDPANQDYLASLLHSPCMGIQLIGIETQHHPRTLLKPSCVRPHETPSIFTIAIEV